MDSAGWLWSQLRLRSQWSDFAGLGLRTDLRTRRPREASGCDESRVDDVSGGDHMQLLTAAFCRSEDSRRSLAFSGEGGKR